MNIKKIVIGILIFIVFTLPIIFLVYTKYPFLFKNNKNNVIILAYHHFVSKEEKEEYFADNQNVMDVDKFEEQLKYLKFKKYYPITLNQLYCWLNNKCQLPKKSILITIDDGNLSTYKYALPLLEKYEFNGVSFVITSRMNQKSDEWSCGKLVFMGEKVIEDIKTNHKRLEIASHSHNLHQTLNDLFPKDVLSSEEIQNDLIKSKELLNTDYFAYPFGSYDEKYIDFLKNTDFKLAFTYGPFKSVAQDENPFLVPRIGIPANISMLKFKMLLKK